MPGIHRIIHLFTLVVLLFGPWESVVHAQEDTGHIYDNHAEIVFPAVIRFFVGVDVPLSQIDTATLTIHQASGLQITLAINPEQHLIETRDDSTDLVYDWDITGDSGPAPFEPLNYQWQIDTEDDDVSVAANEILFEDTAFSPWNSAGDPPLILFWHNPDLAGGAIRDDVLPAYELISRRTARSPLLRYVIYDPRVTLCHTEDIPDSEETRPVVFADDGKSFPCAIDQYIQVYANGEMTFLQRPNLGYAELQDFLVQTMVREAYTRLWAETSVPDWLLAGLTGLYQLRPTYAALQLVQTAARTDSLLTLSEMATRPADDVTFQTRVLWESQSYLLALYLADTYGATAPFDLARDLGENNAEFDSAFQTLVGDAFWDEWTRWLFTEAADKAINWTPYLPNTPTPTSTSTSTPIPPSLTPSPTRTATPTATSTYLGDQQPTAVVQQRVTVTVAKSPTNTPLPPGSLPTASPVPAPTVVTPDDDEEINPALLIGVIVLAGSMLLLMIGVVINRVRR